MSDEPRPAPASAGATTVRLARVSDLPGVMAIERASFPTDAWSESSMRSTIKDRDTVTTVVERDDRVVGYCSVLAPAASDADILTIAIEAAARGGGLGRVLLEGAVDAAEARGCRLVFLEVRVDNPVAQNLYSSVGFVEVGRRRHYYQPDDVDAIVMRLAVPRPVVSPGAELRPGRSGSGPGETP
jgi:[ribosomal protein S18]-alanine N-acetyltransferase